MDHPPRIPGYVPVDDPSGRGMHCSTRSRDSNHIMSRFSVVVLPLGRSVRRGRVRRGLGVSVPADDVTARRADRCRAR